MMSFDQLLDKHRSNHKDIVDGDGVKAAMFQLVSHNTNTQQLIQEGTCKNNFTVSKDGNSNSTNTMSVDILIKSLEDDSVAMGAPVAVAAAVTLANHLQSLLSHDQDDLLLTEEQKSQFDIVEAVLMSLVAKGNINKNTFIKLINKGIVLPTEAIWRLHVAGIMLLDVFITCNLSKPHVIGGLSTNIARLCQAGEQFSKSIRMNIVQGIVCYLITQAYGERSSMSDDATSKGLKKVSMALLDSITKKMLGCYSDKKSFDIHLFVAVMTAPPVVDNAALKRYCTIQMCLVLGHNPVIKVSAALRQQDQWSYAKADGFIKETLSQLLCMFDIVEAVTLMRQVLEQHEVNWQMLLTCSSTILVCYREATPAITKLVRELLKEGMEACQLDGVIAGFLLARQASGEGLHVFPAYQEWFNNMFGDQSNGLTNNKKTFTFFLKFLTDIVPFEAPRYLKAHLLKPPFVPAKCRPILSDYITLAKTRLMDLKEPIEELGIYGDDGNSRSDKVIEQANLDVDKSLLNYDKSGKVPANIMEASIFRKPYFVGHFLPTLLTPRPLPDSSDVRMRFILALHQAEKIPPLLYGSYLKACDKMANQLLQGVFSDDEDDDMNDMLLSPWQQLRSSLTSLREAITKANSSEKNISVASLISVISEKIANYLPAVPPGDIHAHDPDTNRQTFHIEPHVVSTQKEYIQVVHELCALTSDLDGALKDNGDQSEYRLQLLSMLLSHKPLWQAFCSDLIQKLTNKYGSLSIAEIRSTAVTLFYIFTYSDVLPTPPVRHNGISYSYQQYVCTVLTPSFQHRMIFLLQFCYYYLWFGLTRYTSPQLHYTDQHQAVLPHEIITMFTYLSERIIPSVVESTRPWPSYQVVLDDMWPRGVALVIDFYNSSSLKDLIKQHQLPLRNWLKLELGINPNNDLLNHCDRQGYLERRVLGYYLLRPASDGGYNHDIFACLSMMCEALLDGAHNLFKFEPVTGSCNCPPSQIRRGNSHSEIILLLQRLVSMVTMKSVSMTSPWLPQLILRRTVTAESSNDTSRCADVISSFSLVHQLPAYLLLGNTPFQLSKQSPDGAADLFTLINHHWRPCLTTGVVLSLDCTAHVVQSLLSLCPENPSLAEHVLHQCPCVLPSILYHWESLAYLRNLITDGATMPPFTRILQYPALLSHKLDSVIKKQMSLQEIFTEFSTDTWHIGVILKRCIETSNAENRDQLQQLLLEWAESRCFELTNEHPALTCTICLLADMSWQMLYQYELNVTYSCVLRFLWSKSPRLLVRCIQVCEPAGDGSMYPDQAAGGGSIYDLLPHVSKQLLAGVLCRLLIAMPTEAIVNVSQTVGLVQGVLTVYVRCTQLHDTGPTERPGSSISQPLRVHDVVQLSALVQSLLRRSTRSQVTGIPQNVLSSCDPDIKKAVAMALRR